jgi:hypothetical protein
LGCLLSEGIAVLSVLSVWDLIHSLHHVFLVANGGDYSTKERVLATFLGTLAGLMPRVGIWFVEREPKPTSPHKKKKAKTLQKKTLQAAE